MGRWAGEGNRSTLSKPGSSRWWHPRRRAVGVPCLAERRTLVPDLSSMERVGSVVKRTSGMRLRFFEPRMDVGARGVTLTEMSDDGWFWNTATPASRARNLPNWREAKRANHRRVLSCVNAVMAGEKQNAKTTFRARLPQASGVPRGWSRHGLLAGAQGQPSGDRLGGPKAGPVRSREKP
jgi:hypothetical protein